MKKIFTNANNITEKTISNFSHDEKIFTNANNIIEKTISNFSHDEKIFTNADNIIEKTISNFSHDEKIVARFVSKMFHMKLFIFFFHQIRMKFSYNHKAERLVHESQKNFYQRQRV